MKLRGHPLLVCSMAALLVACASGPQQATVDVFTSQPNLPAGTTYRYERLLSQAADPAQAQLEAAADTVLSRAGLRRDEAAPRLTVQITAQQDDPGVGWRGWGGPSVGVGIGAGSGGGGGVGIGLGFPLGGFGGARASQRVEVQLRDLGSGQVVYQSQASAPSGGSPALMVQAALRDFRSALPGRRQVPLATAAPS